MRPDLPLKLTGIVKRYQGNGRKLHYPTANIETSTDLADGVYFGFADLSKFRGHPALIFVGVPVTIGDTQRRTEAHLLDIPDEDYYDLELALELRHFHRPNKSLSSVEELLRIMHEDEAAGRQWFNDNPVA